VRLKLAAHATPASTFQQTMETIPRQSVLLIWNIVDYVYSKTNRSERKEQKMIKLLAIDFLVARSFSKKRKLLSNYTQTKKPAK
jgi:hypothetical protein